jgi:hypothetical protein
VGEQGAATGEGRGPHRGEAGGAPPGGQGPRRWGPRPCRGARAGGNRGHTWKKKGEGKRERERDREGSSPRGPNPAIAVSKT